MAKSKMKRSKNGYLYSVNLNGLTEGELMALVRALRFYNSIVSNDVLCYIRNAAYEGGDGMYEKVDEFIKGMEKDIEREAARVAKEKIVVPA